MTKARLEKIQELETSMSRRFVLFNMFLDQVAKGKDPGSYVALLPKDFEEVFNKYSKLVNKELESKKKEDIK